MSHLSREKLDLVNRTKKVIGQLESVLRGLHEDDSCAAVLQRLSAARGAINSLMAELMEDHILPVALKLGLPKISWNSFRHSAAEWAKRALKLQEAKVLMRHERESTTSELYGGMSLEDKRAVQHQYTRYIKEKAKAEGWRETPRSGRARKPAKSSRTTRRRHRDLI